MRVRLSGLFLLAAAEVALAQQPSPGGLPFHRGPEFVSWEPAPLIASDPRPARPMLGQELGRGEKGALVAAVAMGTAFALARLAWCREDDTSGSNCLGGVLGFALLGGTVGAVLGAFLSGAAHTVDAWAPAVSVLAGGGSARVHKEGL